MELISLNERLCELRSDRCDNNRPPYLVGSYQQVQRELTELVSTCLMVQRRGVGLDAVRGRPKFDNFGTEVPSVETLLCEVDGRRIKLYISAARPVAGLWLPEMGPEDNGAAYFQSLEALCKAVTAHLGRGPRMGWRHVTLALHYGDFLHLPGYILALQEKHGHNLTQGNEAYERFKNICFRLAEDWDYLQLQYEKPKAKGKK